MNKELKEIKERLDKIEKEIEDIKVNYLSTERLVQGVNESMKKVICYE